MPCRGVTACPLLSPDYWTVQSLSGLRGHNHNAACYRMVYTLAKHASIYHLPHGACYPLITIVGLSQRTVLYTHLHHLILLLTSLILSELSYFDCVVPLSLSLSIYTLFSSDRALPHAHYSNLICFPFHFVPISRLLTDNLFVDCLTLSCLLQYLCYSTRR
jgi:hypothetical protein